MNRTAVAIAAFLFAMLAGLAYASGAHSTPTITWDMGTARPAAVGGAWSIVALSGHTPQGLGTPTCDPVTGYLSVPHSQTFTSIVGSSAMTDETWSRQGIIVGASVGYDKTVLWFTKLTADGPVALSCSALAADGNVWITVAGIV